MLWYNSSGTIKKDESCESVRTTLCFDIPLGVAKTTISFCQTNRLEHMKETDMHLKKLTVLFEQKNMPSSFGTQKR